MDTILSFFILCFAVCICSAQDDVCGTCANSCGQHNTYCGCDSLCKIYNDCCADFESKCFSEKRTANVNLFRFRGVVPEKLTKCHSVDFGTGIRRVPMVISCPHDAHACDTFSNGTDVTSLVPVTELSTGLNFVTAQCAECNGVEMATVWTTKLLCDDHVYVSLHIDNSSANSSQVNHNVLQDLLVHPDCKLSIRVPVQARRPCDPDVINTCTDGSRWSEKQCRSGSTDFVNDGVSNYKNRVCAKCNGVTSPLNCGLTTMVFNFSPVIYGKFSLSLLLDYSGNGLMLKSGGCEIGFTKVAHDCLPIVCPSDLRLEGNECIEIPKLDVTIQFYMTLDPEGKSAKIKDTLVKPDFLLEDIHRFLMSRYDNITNLSLSFNVSASVTIYSAEGISLVIPGVIVCTVHNMSMENPAAIPPLKDLSEVIYNSLHLHLTGELSTVTDLKIEMKPMEEQDYKVWEEASTSCTQIQLSPDEYALQNDSIRILTTGQDIELKHVSFGKDGTVAICEQEIIRKPASSSTYLGITTIVVLLLSLLCLLIRIVLQFFITAFHTAPMKTQFCLSLTLFTGFLAFLINPFLREGSVSCHALGIYIHWVFLLAFCWMMVIAFDMWWIFRPSGGFMKLNEGDGFFWRYLFIAVLCSSVITAVSIVFEYTSLSEYFKPDYGSFLCFFNNTRALLVFFVIPLIGIVIINIIFFTMTCVNLHRALSSMQKFQRQKWCQELCLYIRLFSLMGITWTFGIVAPLVSSSDVLWYFFVLFNGLQGLYIFAAYVCTDKVYNEVKRKCGREVPKQSVQTSRTESTSSRGSRRGRYGKSGDSATSDGNKTLDTSLSDPGKEHSNNTINGVNKVEKLPSETTV